MAGKFAHVKALADRAVAGLPARRSYVPAARKRRLTDLGARVVALMLGGEPGRQWSQAELYPAFDADAPLHAIQSVLGSLFRAGVVSRTGTPTRYLIVASQLPTATSMLEEYRREEESKAPWVADY